MYALIALLHIFWTIRRTLAIPAMQLAGTALMGEHWGAYHALTDII